MNKLILLTALFCSTFVFALSEDAKQPIEIEAESVMVDEAPKVVSIPLWLSLVNFHSY